MENINGAQSEWFTSLYLICLHGTSGFSESEFRMFAPENMMKHLWSKYDRKNFHWIVLSFYISTRLLLHHILFGWMNILHFDPAAKTPTAKIQLVAHSSKLSRKWCYTEFKQQNNPLILPAINFTCWSRPTHCHILRDATNEACLSSMLFGRWEA